MEVLHAHTFIILKFIKESDIFNTNGIKENSIEEPASTTTKKITFTIKNYSRKEGNPKVTEKRRR